MSGIVYVFYKDQPFLVGLVDHWNPFTRQYKIGKTKRNVRSRLAIAKTGSSYPVVVHAEYDVRDHHRAEKILHNMFSGVQVQGSGHNEWYHLAPWDLWIISMIVRFL